MHPTTATAQANAGRGGKQPANKIKAGVEKASIDCEPWIQGFAGVETSQRLRDVRRLNQKVNSSR